jgi:hypothetical protein
MPRTLRGTSQSVMALAFSGSMRMVYLSLAALHGDVAKVFGALGLELALANVY